MSSDLRRRKTTNNSLARLKCLWNVGAEHQDGPWARWRWMIALSSVHVLQPPGREGQKAVVFVLDA